MHARRKYYSLRTTCLEADMLRHRASSLKAATCPVQGERESNALAVICWLSCVELSHAEQYTGVLWHSHSSGMPRPCLWVLSRRADMWQKALSAYMPCAEDPVRARHTPCDYAGTPQCALERCSNSQHARDNKCVTGQEGLTQACPVCVLACKMPRL